MVGLYKDPEGKMLFTRTNPSQGNINSSMDKDTIASLKKRVQELESEVSVIHVAKCRILISSFKP